MPANVSTIRRRTVVNLMRTWRELKGAARRKVKRQVRPDLPREDMDYLQRQMVECLVIRGGEVSARARTAELGRIYLQLTRRGRERFLRMLARDFALDRGKVDEAMERYKKAQNDLDFLAAEHNLRDALIAPRVQILRQFNTLPDGFKFLVDMRADLLSMKRNDPGLKGLERDLKELLKSLFDIGLLDLDEITWNSPAALLEKLIAYEAVHKISSWSDLKNRLDFDRRCFAFFHNKMPNEPLIFVEVALVRGMADNIHDLLNEESPVGDPLEADTAIFYSISNAQSGLAGISFGNFLIKRVVAMISSELKDLKTFATLSPVPGFRRWLDPLLEKGDESLLAPSDISAIKQLRPGNNASRALLDILNSTWHEDIKISAALKQPLMGLVAHYLLNEMKGQRALDPVAHFHLSNGARLERMNWLADTSLKGMRESAGVMVNYLYDPSDIDDNHERYVTEGEINASKQIRSLLRRQARPLSSIGQR